MFLPEEVAGLLALSEVKFSEADMLAPLFARHEPGLPHRRLQRLDLMTYCAEAPVEDALRQLREGFWVRHGYWTRDMEKYVRPRDEHWRRRLWSLHLLERWAAHWLS
jgi:hypothetical protein